MKQIMPRHLVVGLLAAAIFAPIARADETIQDLTQIPFERLLEMEVITASKIARQVSDAPSAVSIVTAEDIKAYGYRTLAEVLESMRGLYTTYDRAYYFLGGRGYGRPGDFTGRIMLTIDGNVANDNIYDSANLDTAGLLDTALIERVEYVSGPGSTVYGNNAFFGIINVVTKRGRDFNGLQVAGAAGSYQSREARMTYGKKLENGAEFLVSGSGFNTPGQTLAFQAEPDLGFGGDVARDRDGQFNRRLFGKLEWQNWLFEASYVRRKKDVPTAPYGADFNAPYSYEDSSFNSSLKHHRDLGERLKFSLNAYLGTYDYRGIETFAATPWNEKSAGRWWGADIRFVGTWFKGQKLVFGAEYRDDYKQNIVTPVSEARNAEQTLSFYVQDEITLAERLSLNLGLRYDYNTDVAGNFSPRAALIYSPLDDTTVKLSHSQAYRTAAPFEKYYTDGYYLLPNPDLKPERIRATELVIEHQFGRDSRLLGSLYHYQSQHFISSQVVDELIPASQFLNIMGGRTQGAELEFEQHWDNGIRLRTSYAYQDAKDGDKSWSVNSPHHMGKLNLTAPFWSHLWRAGFEMQAYSERKTEHETRIGGYAVANLTLSSDRLLPNLHTSFSIRNLFDRNYTHVAPDANTYQITIPQDGRNFWLQLSYDFK